MLQRFLNFFQIDRQDADLVADVPKFHRQQLLGRYINSKILLDYITNKYSECDQNDLEIEEIDATYWVVRVPHPLTEEEIAKLQEDTVVYSRKNRRGSRGSHESRAQRRRSSGGLDGDPAPVHSLPAVDDANLLTRKASPSPSLSETDSDP